MARRRIAQNIERLRKARGVTQAELARALRLDRTAVTKIEAGVRGVEAEEVPMIARALGCTVGEILDLRTKPTLAGLRKQRAAIMRVAARRKVRSVLVFGSVARGDARFDSDVDLLVETEPEASFLDVSGFAAELEELLGRDVDVATEGSLRDARGERIRAEAVPL